MVQIARYPNGDRGVCELAGYTWVKGSSSCRVETYFRRDAVTGTKEWLAHPRWLDDLPCLSIATREEVAKWKTSSILLMLASCFAIAFGLLGLSWLFERGLDRRRSQRAVDRTGGKGLIGRILAEGIAPLAGLSKAVLRIASFGLFVEGVVREVRRLDYHTDLVSMGTVLLASSGLVFSLTYAFSFSVIGGLASVVCAFLMVNVWVNRRSEQRKEEMREEIPEAAAVNESLLPDWLLTVSNGSRGRRAHQGAA